MAVQVKQLQKCTWEFELTIFFSRCLQILLGSCTIFTTCYSYSEVSLAVIERISAYFTADCSNSHSGINIIVFNIILQLTISYYYKKHKFQKIQVDAIQQRLLENVDGVLAVHEFHVWQLAGDRIIASAHIRCRNLSEYMKIAEQVKEFFHNEGIHSTTIQPEFIEVSWEEL